MDPTPYLEVKPAPRVVFDALPERAEEVRYRFRNPAGDWEGVTLGAHAAAIRDVAMFVAGEGLEAGARAAVFAPNRVEWMEAALGIQAAGAVLVPVYPSCTASQVSYVLNHAGAQLLFVDTEALLQRVLELWPSLASLRRIVCLDDRIDLAAVVERAAAKSGVVIPFADLEHKVISWSRARAMGATRDRENPGEFQRTLDALSIDRPGIMLYTSGTTGHPKGVPLTHANLGTNTADWLRAESSLLEVGDVDLLWLPMSHIFGYGEACIGNLLGFTTYLTTPAEVLTQMKEVKPQVFMSVPSYWEKLAAAALGATELAVKKKLLMEATGGRLRFCLSGGAGLNREVKELFHACGTLIIEGYGLTETAPTLTLNRPDAFRFDSVGRPFPSVQLKLAEDGEILAKGPNVFSGYHADPEATREAFTEDGWFKTGDVGRFTEDGFLQIVDRKKEILVTAGGKNVPPANIELRFKDDDLISQLVVYGDGKRYLVAGVWLHEDALGRHLELREAPSGARDLMARALIQQRIDRVNAELPSYETIKRFELIERPLSVEEGFLTPTLKLRRKKVYEAFGARLEGLYA